MKPPSGSSPLRLSQKAPPVDRPVIPKDDFVRFLKWCLPRLNLRWPGFRKVHETVRKRLGRRMQALGLASLEAYRHRLETDPSEWRELDRLCRIPISRFYRDKAVYDALTSDVLPGCADASRARGDRMLRVLSAGCASGEEPYTISLIWHLRVSKHYPDVALDLCAIDIDDGMLRRARTACYSAGSFRDLPSDLLERGFSRQDGATCLRDAFRGGVRFEKCDLRVTVPAGPFDLILCRNTVFTYFDEALQRRVFRKLDAGLRDGGFLIIGSHEALPPQASGYSRTAPGLPVFRKRSRKASANALS